MNNFDRIKKCKTKATPGQGGLYCVCCTIGRPRIVKRTHSRIVRRTSKQELRSIYHGYVEEM